MKEKILRTIDFGTLIDRLENETFKNHVDVFNVIVDDLVVLCDSNFMCYKANMEIINARKEKDVNIKDISYFENIARTVGESRVNRKAKINQKINGLYNNPPTEPEGWMSDDIVYSIGEMLDRISIEHIKQNHFLFDNMEDKTKASKKWQKRVMKYLTEKLDEIEKKQFYEINDEARTYKI